MSVIQLLLAVFKAIPVLKQIWDRIIAAYVQHEIDKIHERDIAAIRKAINEKDQRDLEKTIGSTKPGEASGLPYSDIVDSLPNTRP